MNSNVSDVEFLKTEVFIEPFSQENFHLLGRKRKTEVPYMDIQYLDPRDVKVNTRSSYKVVILLKNIFKYLYNPVIECLYSDPSLLLFLYKRFFKNITQIDVLVVLMHGFEVGLYQCKQKPFLGCGIRLGYGQFSDTRWLLDSPEINHWRAVNRGS